MKRGPTGTYFGSTTGQEPVRSFIPDPLPPNPPLMLDGELRERADQALLALGRLDSVSTLLPDTSLFLYMYVRKEAVLSSQIEGTQSSLSDLLLFELEEAPGVPFDDVQEVSSYVRALDHGLERIRSGFPLSNRLLKEVHGILLSKGRGSEKTPGDFRTSQNWIGGARPGIARFVPPPAQEVPRCMSDLEKFVHDEPLRTPTLIKAGLAHVQFETIHPFLDGNGRLGRLLIPFLFCVDGVLREPLLYLSLYFKQHRDTYYELLQLVREDGDWEEWMDFFLTGVEQTAAGAVDAAQRIVRLFAADRVRIQGIGRPAGSALRVHEALQQHPVLTIGEAAKRTGLTVPTVTASFEHLRRIDIVSELTGRKRGRIYSYSAYLSIVGESTNPDAS